MLNEFRTTKIIWDKATKKIHEPINVSSSDNKGQKLLVQVVNKGEVEDVSGLKLSLYWETPNKKFDGLDAFDEVDARTGEFELYYTTGMLSNTGRLNAALVLIDPVGRVVSDWFDITVTKGINDTAAQSSNSFTALTQALATVSRYDNRISTLENTLKDYTIVVSAVEPSSGAGYWYQDKGSTPTL